MKVCSSFIVFLCVFILLISRYSGLLLLVMFRLCSCVVLLGVVLGL